MHIYWFLILMAFVVALFRSVPVLMMTAKDGLTQGFGVVLTLAASFAIAYIVMVVFNRTAAELGVIVTMPYWLSYFSIFFWGTITNTLKTSSEK